MRILSRVILTAILASSVSVSVAAQKGTGEQTGVAQSMADPEISTVTGKLLEIESGPCENTTGWAVNGTHLILESADGTKHNIHLGPMRAVSDFVETLEVGEEISAEVFRTERLPENAFVAVQIEQDDHTFVLRGASLQPFWAASADRGRGRGYGARGTGRGMSRGYARGSDRGWSRAPRRWRR